MLTNKSEKYFRKSYFFDFYVKNVALVAYYTFFPVS